MKFLSFLFFLGFLAFNAVMAFKAVSHAINAPTGLVYSPASLTEPYYVWTAIIASAWMLGSVVLGMPVLVLRAFDRSDYST